MVSISLECLHFPRAEQFRTKHKSGMKFSETWVRKMQSGVVERAAVPLSDPGGGGGGALLVGAWSPSSKKTSNVVISLMEIVLKIGCSGVGVPGSCLVPSE